MKATVKKNIAVIFSIILVVLALPHTAFAMEEVYEARTRVYISANVPQGFDETIGFVLEQDNTKAKFQRALTLESEYKGSISVIRGQTYTPLFGFPSKDKYNVDVAEKYEIDGESVEISFTVTPITYSAESDEVMQPTTDTNTLGAEIDETTRLPKAETVLEKFVDTVSFMENDEQFDSFLSLYSGKMYEQYYLEADPMNTLEQWESMSRVDKFVYHLAYHMPYLKMMNYDYANANEFIEETDYVETLLSQAEDGDIVYDAIVEVWSWHFRYWQTTGTFCNFFSYSDSTNANISVTSETVTATEKDREEFAEIQAEIRAELGIEEEESSEEKPVILIILIGVGIGIGIALGAVYLYNKKKVTDSANK